MVGCGQPVFCGHFGMVGWGQTVYCGHFVIICCGQTDFCGHFVRGNCGQNVMWTIRSMWTKQDSTHPRWRHSTSEEWGPRGGGLRKDYVWATGKKEEESTKHPPITGVPVRSLVEQELQKRKQSGEHQKPTYYWCACWKSNRTGIAEKTKWRAPKNPPITGVPVQSRIEQELQKQKQSGEHQNTHLR